MIVVTLTDCPISLRGDITKWLLEINTGVFVGRVSARVRDNLWKRIIQNVKNGKATLVYSTNNEQHMDFRVHNSGNEIIDFDGLKLVMKPSPARTKSLSKKRMGFSKASRLRISRRAQNRQVSELSVQQEVYPSNYVVVDLETSGLDVEGSEIIEIGMLRVVDDEIIDTFHTLIKPRQVISKQIERLTGLNNEVLTREGKQIREVFSDVQNFIGRNILLGHNVSFDVNFLNQVCSNYGYAMFENKFCDTMKMYTKILNGRKASKKLLDVAIACKVNVSESHRSLSDCYTIKAVFDVLKQQCGSIK